MSSSSSCNVAAGAEPEVVSATPAGPYWPRGFFTPGRLTGSTYPGADPKFSISFSLLTLHQHTETSASSPVLLVLVGLNVVVPAKGMAQVCGGDRWDGIKDCHISLRWDIPEDRPHHIHSVIWGIWRQLCTVPTDEIISVSCSVACQGFQKFNGCLLLSIMLRLFFVCLISGLVALTRVASEKRADVGSRRRNSNGSFAQFS